MLLLGQPSWAMRWRPCVEDAEATKQTDPGSLTLKSPIPTWPSVSLAKKVNSTGILSRHYSHSLPTPHYERFCYNREPRPYLLLVPEICSKPVLGLIPWSLGHFCSEPYKQIPKVAFLVREHKNSCTAPSAVECCLLKITCLWWSVLWWGGMAPGEKLKTDGIFWIPGSRQASWPESPSWQPGSPGANPCRNRRYQHWSRQRGSLYLVPQSKKESVGHGSRSPTGENAGRGASQVASLFWLPIQDPQNDCSVKIACF